MFEKLLSVISGKKDRLMYIPASEIAPNPKQPRKEFDAEELRALTDSIKHVGILQPIAVRVRPSPPTVTLNNVTVTAPAYEIIAGERRWRAAVKAGVASIPCLVFEANDNECSVMALVENIQRKQLNLFDEAQALYDLLCVSEMTQSELAKKLSISQASLSNKIRLLRFNDTEKREISLAGMGERHARAFLRVENDKERLRLIRKAADKSLTASETERMIDTYLKGAELLQAEAPEPVHKPRRIGFISDLKFFYNTIDRAVQSLSDLGIKSECTRVNRDGVTEVVIRIPDPRSVAHTN